MKIYIREFGTDKIVDTLDVSNKSERSIEKITMGLLRNMDTERFYVDTSEPDKHFRNSDMASG